LMTFVEQNFFPVKTPLVEVKTRSFIQKMSS
jgi:hypothetical protein